MTEDGNPSRILHHALEHAAHLLPAQAPLTAFVHHNTLHAFEDLPFHEGLERAAEVLSAEPYPSERLYQRLMREGSLLARDVNEEVEADESLRESPSRLGQLSLSDFAKTRLQTFFEVPTDATTTAFLRAEELLFTEVYPGVSQARAAELQQIARTRYPKSASPVHDLLLALWESLTQSAPLRSAPTMTPGCRRHDQLLLLGAGDIDSLTHPQLIRLAGAFVDQGIAYWEMPSKERGFYPAVRALLAQPGTLTEIGQAGLCRELARQQELGFDAEAACLWALAEQQVPEQSWETYLSALLLSLRGWAGMFHQLELRPDKAPIKPIIARLIDFAAVMLLFEVFATRHALRRLQGALPSPPEPRSLDRLVAEHLLRDCEPGTPPSADTLAVYEAFIMAQFAPVDLGLLLDGSGASTWFKWQSALPPLRRRRLLLGATERHHLRELSEGLLAHQEWLAEQETPAPAYQAVFCIDDREESYRRHLEEVDPEAETFSYPGFFGVAMRFSGAGEFRSKDLCPVVIAPTHAVKELPLEEEKGTAWSKNGYHFHVGSRTLFRGLALSALGWLSLVPLVLSVLFPRWFHLGRKKAEPQRTRLLYEDQATRDPEHVNDDDAVQCATQEDKAELRGYRPTEMTPIVESFLREMGLTSKWTPLILLIGHGSSSINNPHLSAYGCGATAGGCGGPNARVLAAMANRTDVRAELKSRGLDIPETTWFVGGMHDTCTDEVTLYDREVTDIGAEATASLRQAKNSLRLASENNALERCRLFGQLALDITAKKAKAIVESRSVDLAEPRPEYNHAKNSCCVVGRRKFTRGLFLDQRAFLVSYDPSQDEDGQLLTKVLLGSVPVGMGINLEYFFSQIDQGAYGAGSKLPHNVSGLIGVMDGHSSDLRTGLYAQMVELHEPLRLVGVIEAPPAVLEQLLARQPVLANLVKNGWIQVLSFLPETRELFHFRDGAFHKFRPATVPLPEVQASGDWFKGKRNALPPAHVTASFLSKTARTVASPSTFGGAQ